ncbi:hypothetical protein C2845_PM05G25900 [Panicum miliaceum]|uniref:Uncharacterized protein n=1 Tax=Panicum miliaceum TaxID=4540 RepID=A0A3L6T0I4_PANMI|nr:hypothetical protein C2845_PM05G25900 [Panicum miliaceum]
MGGSSRNYATAALLEAGAPATSADEPPAPSGAVKLRHRILGAARVACDCGIIGSHFMLTSLDVREGPWRRLQLALVGLAYAAVAALVWFGRGLPPDGSAQWKKLAATLAATGVGGVLAYCTNSTVPCGLFLFIYIL